ncbi:MAG: hypothetical protein ACFB6R_17935 [Alphaproteobacteria bacterium]
MADLTSLISNLYEAALDEEAWGGVMRTLEGAFGAHVSALHVVGRGSDLILESNINPETMALYQAQYWARDPWLKAGQGLQPGAVATGASLFPRDDFDPAHRHDILDADDIEDILTVKTQLAPDWQGFLSVYRGKKKGLFQHGDMKRMARIAGHVTRVVRIRETLALQTQTAFELDEAFYRVRVASLLVNDVLRISWSNEKGEALIRDLGLSRRLAGEFPFGTDGEVNAIQAAVLSAMHQELGSELVIRGTRTGRALHVEIVPLSDRIYEKTLQGLIPARARRRCLMMITPVPDPRSNPAR